MSRKQKLFHFIYKTTDIRNGNFYIGMHSTNNLGDGYIGSGTRLKHLIYKHGKDIFNMEILEFLPDRKSLKLRESEIVTSDLILEEKCMNLKPGGYGGFNNDTHQFNCSQAAGLKHAERMIKDDEYRKKYSEKLSKSGKKRHQEGNLKNFTYDWTGRRHSEESKKKMSETAKKIGVGEGNSQFGTMWITKDSQNKKIKKDDFPFYSIDGWVKGRILKK
jgi:hypothetical protein